MERYKKYVVASLLAMGLALGQSYFFSTVLAADSLNVPAFSPSEIAFGSQPGPTDDSTSGLLANEPLDSLDLGRQRYLSGQFAAAIETWQTTIQSAQERADDHTQVIALSYSSLAYQALNQWTLAQDAIEQSIALLEQSSTAVSPLLWAQALNTRASLSYGLGQAELALATWQKAEDYYSIADDKAGVLGSQINQTQALQSLGYYRRSRQQLEAIAQQLGALPDSAMKVNGLRSLGSALRVLGDLEGSRAALFESANIAVAIDATNELSTTYLSLGRAANDWGDRSAAIAMF
ncbi:MAG: hypothetical protein AAF716_17825, partial [Cyanobacteria bacterium P01_D01_bin.1]